MVKALLFPCKTKSSMLREVGVVIKIAVETGLRCEGTGMVIEIGIGIVIGVTLDVGIGTVIAMVMGGVDRI